MKAKVIIDNNYMRYEFLRIKSGLNKKEIALKLNFSQANYKNKIENGNAGFKFNKSLAKVINCEYTITTNKKRYKEIVFITDNDTPLFDLFEAVLKRENLTIQEYASKLGSTPQNLKKALNAEFMDIETINDKLSVLGYECSDYFVFDDGTVL